MITRIESNCTTGQVKYFDENNIEINPEDALIEINANIASSNKSVI